MKIKKLTQAEETQVEEIRQAIFKKLRDVPPEGVDVNYLGKDFRVLPGVFWPHEDSKEIVRHLKINPTDTVLDLFTGSGVIAIQAALMGAKKVVAVDINPAAVETVKINAKRFGVEDKVEARVSDVFSSIRDGEKFDVITGNPPFSNKKVSDISQSYIEQTIKDFGLVAQTKIFEGLNNFLKPGGRAYFSQANFGGVNEMLAKAKKAGFSCKLIGTNPIPPRIFYAFELKRRGKN